MAGRLSGSQRRWSPSRTSLPFAHTPRGERHACRLGFGSGPARAARGLACPHVAPGGPTRPPVAPPVGQDDPMSSEQPQHPHGVVFPLGEDGHRSTTALGRAVIADALRPVDPVGARAAESESAWRSNYLAHFRRAVEAGLGAPEDARAVARDGLASLHERMRVAVDGAELRLEEWSRPDGPPIVGTEVRGSAEPERELTLPYRGERLRGDQ